MIMLNKKAAIELSLNFLVIIIISLVIFTFGIRFIMNLSSKGTELVDLSVSELDQKIGSIVCEGSDRICVGIDKITIKRKDFGVFGVKIINVLPDTKEFEISITRPTPSGYTKSKQDIPSDSLQWNPKQRSIDIDKNDEATVGIGVGVPAEAVSGTYIFNVEIKTSTGQPYSPIQKLYVVVP